MVIGFKDFHGFIVLMLCWFTDGFRTALLLPIFLRKKFKKFWQRLFEKGIWLSKDFHVGLLVS